MGVLSFDVTPTMSIEDHVIVVSGVYMSTRRKIAAIRFFELRGIKDKDVMDMHVSIDL